MSAITTLDWLNENELRSFPFTTTGEPQGWLDSFIVDARLTYTKETIPATVALESVILNDTSFTFNFTHASSPSTVSFTAPATPITVPYVYIRNSYGSLLVVSKALYDYYWNLSLRIPTTFTLSGISVEPSRCSEHRNEWLGVDSLTFNPAYQSDNTSDIKPTLPLVSVSPSALTGDVVFQGGYNVELSLTSLNALDISIGGSYGEPIGCTDQFIDPALTDCNDIISFINGLPPDASGNLNFVAGTNTNVFSGNTLPTPVYNVIDATTDARPFLVFVGLTFETSDICAPVTIFPGG